MQNKETAPTIRDVAKKAQTSVAAVSATLSANANSSIRVGQATRERIVAAAANLGYKPNRLAQSLVLRRTGVLGLVFPYSHAFIDRNPFCSQIMSGVIEAAVSAGYNLMLHTAAGDDWNAADDSSLIDSRVDGLILVLPEPYSPVVTRCIERAFPCVSVVYQPHLPEICAVNADEYTGGMLATQHLLQLGHRRIAHLGGNPSAATTEPRRLGYVAALREAGVEPDPALIVSAGFDWKHGMAAMRFILDELSPDRQPTAVFACNDLCAEGAIRLMRERGLKAPDDMALVGYDDTWFATMTDPPLTSVHMPIYEMGGAAANLLIDVVEGRSPDQRQPVLPVSLTVRASCGASVPD